MSESKSRLTGEKTVLFEYFTISVSYQILLYNIDQPSSFKSKSLILGVLCLAIKWTMGMSIFIFVCVHWVTARWAVLSQIPCGQAMLWLLMGAHWFSAASSLSGNGSEIWRGVFSVDVVTLLILNVCSLSQLGLRLHIVILLPAVDGGVFIWCIVLRDLFTVAKMKANIGSNSPLHSEPGITLQCT